MPSTDSSNKAKALQVALAQIEKNFGKGAAMTLGEAEVRSHVKTFPSGSPSLDLALGKGYPRGRVIEIYGPESSGKTTLALHAIAEMQKLEGKCVFIDAEHALDPSYAQKIGVNIEDLIISQPDSGEQALSIAETFVNSGAIDLIVIDSVAALTPRAEIEGEMGDSQMGLQARLMSQALRKLTGAISRTGTTVIFLNQIRMKIGILFGNPETTTGGNALKFYSSVRLDIRRIGKIDQGTGSDKVITGNRTRVKVVKNKVAPPFRVTEFDILYNHGIDYLGDLLDLAVKYNIITKAGASYSYGEKKLGVGRSKVITSLRSETKLQKQLEEKIRSAIESSEKAELNPEVKSSK